MTDDEPMVIRTKEGLEVTINADGTVTFSNLPENGPPEDLVELIYSLNPDAVIACDSMPRVDDGRSN
jgi:hypothetical protein